MPLSTLEYASTKVKAVAVKAGFRLIKGSPVSHPDSILDIQSRQEGRTIRAHVYKPSNAQSPSPVLINFHGSGWMIYVHGESDAFCRQIADETGYTVIDASYRMAPENPFPESLNDAEDAINYVLKRPEKYDLKQFAISGFSAGGNMALAAAAVLFPKNTFTTVMTFYAPINFAMDLSAQGQPDPEVPVQLGPGLIRWLTTNYLQNHDFDFKDPRLSPYFADLERWPQKVLLIAAGTDSLRVDSNELYDKLKDSGDRKVVFRVFEKVPHAWDTEEHKPGTVKDKAKRDAYALAVSFLLE